MIERRRHYRFLVGGSAILRATPKMEIDAKLKDISLGGVAVYAAETIPLGQALEVEIHLTDSNGAELGDTIAGRVVRSQTWGDRRIYGIEFDEPIAREDNALLYVFLENLKKTTDLPA